MEEGSVEAGIEIVEFLFAEFLSSCELVKFIIVTVLHHLVHPFAEVVYLIDIHGAKSHEVSHIFFLHAV